MKTKKLFIVLLPLMITVLLVACGQKSATTDKEETHSASSGYTPVVKDEHTIYTRDQIAQFMSFKKSELIAYFGDEYEEVSTGAEGLMYGIIFKDTGLSFAFEKEEDEGTADYLSYDSYLLYKDGEDIVENPTKIEIDGVRIPDTNFKSIESLWGKGKKKAFEATDTWPVESYQLGYEFDGLSYKFNANNKNGDENLELYIDRSSK